MPLDPALVLDADLLKDFVSNSDFTHEEAKRIVSDLRHHARPPRSLRRVEEILSEVSDWAHAHGVEVAVDEDSREELCYYINTGDTYNESIIFDLKSGTFYAMSLGDYVEDTDPIIWEIPVSVAEGESGYGYVFKTWVIADTLEDALQHLIEMEIEHGSSEIWGDDPNYDSGSIETVGGPSTDPEHQFWYMTGIDPDADEEEMENGGGILTKDVRVYPSDAKVVGRDDVTNRNRLFDSRQ